jgi:hypothetical protein
VRICSRSTLSLAELFHAHNKHNFYYYKTKQFMLALLYFKEKYLSYLSNAHFTADFSDQNHNSVIF